LLRDSGTEREAATKGGFSRGPSMAANDEDEDEWSDEETAEIVVSTDANVQVTTGRYVRGGAHNGVAVTGMLQRSVMEEDDNVVGDPESDARNALDEVLRTALLDVRNRRDALKLEALVVKFMHSSKDKLALPPISSYHRLLLHKIADRFGLERRTFGRNAKKMGISIHKTEYSAIPTVLLSSCDRKSSVGPVSIKMRKNGGKGNGREMRSSSARIGGASRDKRGVAEKTQEQRQKEYADARKKIFGDDEDTTDDIVATAKSASSTKAMTFSAGPPSDEAVGFARQRRQTEHSASSAAASEEWEATLKKMQEQKEKKAAQRRAQNRKNAEIVARTEQQQRKNYRLGVGPRAPRHPVSMMRNNPTASAASSYGNASTSSHPGLAHSHVQYNGHSALPFPSFSRGYPKQ